MAENMSNDTTNPMTRHADEVTLRTTENQRYEAIEYSPRNIQQAVVNMSSDIFDLLSAHAALAAKCERLEGAIVEAVTNPDYTNPEGMVRKLRAALAPQPEDDGND